MKFLHLGDLHLGKTLGEFDLIDDQRYILEQILEIICTEKVQAVLIAGDVFDRAIPSEAAVRLLDWFLSELAKAQVSTFMISGNHDSDDRLHFGSSLFTASGIFISSVFDGSLHSVTLTDAYGEADVYLMPFVKASQVRHFYPDDKIVTYEDAVRTILMHTQLDRSRRNILVAHQFVAGKMEIPTETGATGGQAVRAGEDIPDEAGSAGQAQWLDPKLGGSEGAASKSVGLVERIGFDCFDDFDYVALGHIHSPQQVGREAVRYAGSPLKYSLSEADNSKSVPLIDMKEKGNMQISLLALEPMRDLRHLKGPLKMLLDERNVSAPDDFIYATLTDEDVISEAMGIFRQTYPNTLRIDYDNSHTRQSGSLDMADFTETRSFAELIADFYRQMYGCEISEEELQIMKQVAGEAGVADETH